MKRFLLLCILILSCTRTQDNYIYENNINTYYFVIQETDDYIKYYKIIKKECSLIYISDNPSLVRKRDTTEILTSNLDLQCD